MSENTKFNKSDLSTYKLERRSFGWGANYPTHWTPGGFFYSSIDQAVSQNIQTDPRLPASWKVCGSTLARAEGIILALG